MKEKIIYILKKIYSILVSIITAIALIFIAAFVFGLHPYTVISGSMEPKIPVGSVCFVNTHAKYENIKKGDIITFKIGQKTTATHRANKITKNGIITKGDANSVIDDNKVTKENFVGKVVLIIPKIGFIFEKIKKPVYAVLAIIIVLMLVVLGAIFDKK